MDVTFALPTLSDAAMSDNDQKSILRVQALAVIVSAYLDHAAQVYAVNQNDAYRFTQAELVSLINDVQAAIV
jgi:hypothetical protein